MKRSETRNSICLRKIHIVYSGYHFTYNFSSGVKSKQASSCEGGRTEEKEERRNLPPKHKVNHGGAGGGKGKDEEEEGEGKRGNILAATVKFFMCDLIPNKESNHVL